MKKMKCLFATIITTILCSVGVMAANGDVFNLEEIGVEVSVPGGNGLDTYTRESKIEEGDIHIPIADYFMENMENNNEYLRSYDVNNVYTISLFSKKTNLADFSSLEDQDVVNVVQSGLDGLLERKRFVGDIMTPKPETIKFAAADIYEESSTNQEMKGYFYATITNGRIYCFVLAVNTGEVTDGQREIVRLMATECNYQSEGTEETTIMTVIGAPNSSTTEEKNAVGASDMMGKVVGIAKIVVGVLLAIALLIIVHGFLANRRIEKERPVQIAHPVRRTPQYEDRIRRVMSNIPEAAPQEEKTSSTDLLEDEDNENEYNNTDSSI